MAQFFEAVLPGSPLPSKIQTQSSTDPCFEVREDPRSLAESEVAAPSHDVWLQLFDQLLQTEPPCPACHGSDPPLEFVERLWRDAPLAPVIRDAEPKKLALFRSRHRALRLVDLEPQLVGQEPAHRGHDPFTGASAANIDVAVVSIPAKAVTASGQFFVEVVKHESARMGESGPPCGVRSSTGRTKPSSITPALRNARISLSTRLSDTRAATRAIRLS